MGDCDSPVVGIDYHRSPNLKLLEIDMKELLPFWPQIFILLYLIGGQLRDWFLDGTEKKLNFSPFKAMVIQGLYLWVIIQRRIF